MGPVLPAQALLGDHQPQIGLVDQGGGLEGVVAPLAPQALPRDLPQLVVEERHQAVRGPRVAAAQRLDDRGDFLRAGAFQSWFTLRTSGFPALSGCSPGRSLSGSVFPFRLRDFLRWSVPK